MRFIIILLALPLLTYGGVKSYLLYSFKTGIDNAITNISSVAVISYESIFSTLDGSMGVRNVIIRPAQSEEEITIRELSLHRPDLLSLIVIAHNIESGKFPHKMGIRIRQLHVELDSNSLATAVGMQEPDSDNFLLSLGGLGCGRDNMLSLREYTDMGYTRTALDVDFDYEYMQKSQQLQYKIAMTEPKQFKLSLSMLMAFDPAVIQSGYSNSDEPAVKQLSVNYVDNGFYKMRNSYCSKQTGSSVEQYVDRHLKLLMAKINGHAPEAAVNAYRTLMLKGGNFSMSMNPQEPVMLSEIKFYKQNLAMGLLDLKFSINQVVVDGASIDWRNGKSKTKKSQNVEMVAKVDTVKKQSKTMLSEANKKRKRVRDLVRERTGFHTVNAARISKYVGKNVQISTHRGKFREGLLESVTPENIRIIIRFGGGEYELPIKKADISELKVYL